MRRRRWGGSRPAFLFLFLFEFSLRIHESFKSHLSLYSHRVGDARRKRRRYPLTSVAQSLGAFSSSRAIRISDAASRRILGLDDVSADTGVGTMLNVLHHVRRCADASKCGNVNLHVVVGEIALTQLSGDVVQHRVE